MCGKVTSSWISATHEGCHVTVPSSRMSAGTVMRLKDEVSSLKLHTLLPAALSCLSALWLRLVRSHLHTMPGQRLPADMLQGSYSALFSPPLLSLCIRVCVHITEKLVTWNPLLYPCQTISTNNIPFMCKGVAMCQTIVAMCSWTWNPQTKVINWCVMTGYWEQITREQ